MWGTALLGGSMTAGQGEHGLARDVLCTARVWDSGEQGVEPLWERTVCTDSSPWEWLPSGAAGGPVVGSDG